MSSPLTASNLAALEEGTSSKPEAPTYIFRVGISKSTAYDFIYEDERRSRFVDSDRIGPKQPVHGRTYFPPNGQYEYMMYYPDFPAGKSPVRPVQFNAVWDQAAWTRLVHNELVRIRKAAQEKRNKIHALAIRCPYKPWTTFVLELLTTIFGRVLDILKPLPRVLFCILGILFAVIFYSIFPILLILILLPVAKVKDGCCPANPAIRASWFEELFKSNPDLDTFAIDTEVKRELDMTAEKLNTAYPQFVVDVSVGQESHEWGSYDEGSVHVNRWTEHYDRFILQFREAAIVKT